MFSKLVLKFLRNTVNDGHKWGCLPYKWDPRNSSIIITVHGSWTRRYLWYFNIAFYTIYMVYLGGRYLQRQLDGSPLRIKLSTEYIFSVYVLPLVIRWCIFIRYEELADFLNASLKFFRELDSPHQRRQGTDNSPDSPPRKVQWTMRNAAYRILENNRRRHIFDMSNNNVAASNYLETQGQGQGFRPHWPREKDSLLPFIFATAFLIKWLDVLTAFTRPEIDHLFTSVLPNPEASPIWLRALLVIPHVYIWWTTWAVLKFTVVHFLTYVRVTVVTINWAKNLSQKDGSREDNSWALFRRTYRPLQLLQGKQHDALGFIISAHKVIMTLQTVRSLVIVIAHLDEGWSVLAVPAVMGVGSWVYLHYAFRLFGSIYEESSECLFQWQAAHRSPRWFRRTFIRSCWPLKIYIGGEMYYADRRMNLTMNTEILQKIVDAVLGSL